jgi:amino acid adenylation domain-containing protein
MSDTLTAPELTAEEKRARLAELLRRKAGPLRQFPLSFAQQRLWFLDQMEPGNTAYSIISALRMTGTLDTAAMERAVGDLLRRHEPLRTVFRTAEGQPVQVVLPFREPRVPVEPFDGPEEGRKERALALVAEETAKPFDLAKGPLFRARLLRLGADDHVLLLAMHHIVTDGWSIGVLYRELCTSYAAYAEGREPELPALPIQYADYAAWQRGPGQEAVLAEQLGFWRATLADAPALLEMPLDRPRPPVQTHAGGMVRLRYPPAFGETMRSLAHRLEVTPFMVVLAAFYALLSRWSGQDDVVVGTPTAGRSRKETEGLVGFFINTLALRCRTDGDPTFAELVERVRRTTIDAYGHQDVPFERVVDELKVERALSHSPIAQVNVILHTEPVDPIVLGDLRLALVEPEPESAQHELSFSLRDRWRGMPMEFDVEYNRDLFDRATVERLADHFHALFMAAAADPSLRLSQLPLGGDEERAEALTRWNRTEAVYAAEPIHALVSAQAKRTPDAVAVTGGAESLTYAALEERSDRLAAHFRAAGVRGESLVAISMERSPALLVAMLATWKAGAAYVPVDPAYPADRRAYMLADSGARVVLADSVSADGIPAAEGQSVVVVDRIDLANGSAPSEDTEAAAGDADALAYVIYTSGSTGKPKGVMVPHRGVANFLHSMGGEPGMTADDVLVAVTSLSFDIAILELLLPLLSGARTVIATREQALDPARLSALLAETGATVMQATPATWRMLVRAGWEGDPRLAILSGGEALAPDLARELLPCGRALWNLYGPTETTVWSAVERVEAADAVRLGRPVANTALYVLDPNGQPCPAGVPGELFIGGDGVVRGYLRRPALTAERFVPDPFGTAAGARLYRTGDRVRRRTDGTLEFLGRVDFQVKLRGFRIELGEIEAALMDQPGVREAVAVVREDVAGDARLVAYVVPEGTPPSPDALRTALAARLPDYMVPGAFVTLEALPLTPNGKTDRRALPAPEAAAPTADAARIPPRTPAEKAVAAIWRDVLRTDDVGVDDNFFNVGGHSLLLAQVAARLQEWLGREVPLLDLFRHTTIAAQAAHVAGEGGAESATARAAGGRASQRLAARPARGG